MALYKFPDGNEYEFASDAEATVAYKAWDKQFGSEKEKTSIVDDIGASIRGVPEMLDPIVANIVGQTGKSLIGRFGKLGNEKRAQKFQDDMVEGAAERRKEHQERESKLDRGGMYPVTNALTTLPAYLNPVSAGVMMGGGTMETMMRLLDDGASTETALLGGAADMGINAATLGAGQKLNVASKMGNAVLQSGTNVAQEALINHPTQNAIRSANDLRSLPDMTGPDYAAAAVPGAILGHMMAPGVTPKAIDAPVVDTPSKTPADLDKTFTDNTSAVLNSISKQIEEVDNKRVALSSDSRGMTAKQKKYYDALGEKRTALQQELVDNKLVLDKYDINTPIHTEADAAEAIKNLDLSFINDFEKKQLGIEIDGSDRPHMTIEELVRADADKAIEKSKERKPLVSLNRNGPYIDTLDVQEGFQRQGLGKQAVKEAEAEIAAEGHKVVFLQAKPESVGFWEKMGYIKDPKQVEEAGENIMMHKTLSRKDPITKEPWEDGPPAGMFPEFKKPAVGARPDEAPFSFGENTRQANLEDIGTKQLARDGTPIEEVFHLKLDPKTDLDSEGNLLSRPRRDTKPLSPAQLRATYEKNIRTLESVNKRIAEVEAFDTGQTDTVKLHAYREGLETLLSKQKEALDYYISKGISLEAKKSQSRNSTANPEETTGSKNAVFKNDWDELYQKLRNGGNSDASARKVANETYPEMDEKSPKYQGPSRKGGVGKKQGGAILSPAKIITDEIDNIKNMHSAIELSNIIDVTNLRSAEDLLKESTSIDDPKHSLVRQGFGVGQFVESVKRTSPILWEAFKRIKSAHNDEIAMKRELWGTNASFFSLKETNDWTSLNHAIPHATIAEKVKVHELMEENANNLRKHSEQDTSNLTQREKKLYDLMTGMYDKVLKKTRPDERFGYIHAFRKGDFAVGLKTTKGDVAHLESFPNERIAKEYQREMESRGFETTNIIDHKAEDTTPLSESFATMKDIISHLNKVNPSSRNEALSVLDAAEKMVADKATIGQHNQQKTGMTGFAGTRMLRTREQNAEDFFNSVEPYIGEVSAQWRKTQLNRSKVNFWENDAGRELAAKYPNQKETADFLYDTALNNHNKYTVAEWIDRIKVPADNLFSKAVSGSIGTAKKIPFLGKKIDYNEKFYYPEVNVIDKTTGLFAQIFYISALTSRPGFWAGQLLSAPFAVRQFLKEGNSLETLLASSKGWGDLMTGGNKDFQAFKEDFYKTTDSTTPQFKNEINTIKFLSSKGHDTLNKMFDTATGQSIAGFADTASRKMVMAVAYNFYKDKGFTGVQLKDNVRNALDNTMVMYDRAQSSPMFDRMGLVGQQIAPLQKYGIAQLANLVGDLQYVAQTKGGANKIRAMAPVISTLLTTMIMGGSIGLPLLAEYELIRKAFIMIGDKIGVDMRDNLPGSVYEMMLTHDNVFQKFAQGMFEGAGTSKEFAKDASTHGVLSAATGMDIGSSLRFNPYVPGADTTSPPSVLNGLPVIKSTLDLAEFALVKGKKVVGAETTQAEQRQADLKFQLFPGQRALMDKFRYNSDNREFVPGGNRGYAQVKQTPKEQLAQVLGTSTLETAKTKAKVRLEEEQDRELAGRRQKAIDMAVDAFERGDDAALNKAIKKAVSLEMNKKMVDSAMKRALINRNKTREEARYSRGMRSMPRSSEEKRKYLEDRKYD